MLHGLGDKIAFRLPREGDVSQFATILVDLQPLIFAVTVFLHHGVIKDITAPVVTTDYHNFIQFVASSTPASKANRPEE